jgi:hypothetical protein
VAKHAIGVKATVTESLLVWKIEGGFYGRRGVMIILRDVAHDFVLSYLIMFIVHTFKQLMV